VYLLARRETRDGPALWAGLALLTSPYFLERAHWANLDVPLTLVFFLSVMAVLAACSAENARRSYLLSSASGLALGAAILLKGPVPLVFFWTAWVAHMAVTARLPERTVRIGLWWALGALTLEVAIQMARGLRPETLAWLRAPVPLCIVVPAWTILVWRGGRSARARDLGRWALALGTSAAVAAPWAIAVLVRKGWPYIHALLFEQVFERTYTASEINSGSPFFYVIFLPVMLAPWGFLLPFHFSRHEWSERPALYRYSVVIGWAGVVVFSLISGKEREYVLPVVPFLLIATGHHLADLTKDGLGGWTEAWGRVWQRAMAPVLALVAVGCAVYGSTLGASAILLVELWAFAAMALACALMAHKRAQWRTACIFTLALLAATQWILVRNVTQTAAYSPRELARLCGQLSKRGCEVEASRIYPEFAFYAGVAIPVEMDAAAVREKLTSNRPYFYVIRQELYDPYFSGMPEGEARMLAGPETKRKLILVGNAPLPSELALDSAFP
jgi:4-amino-4-deoxy-L-arabinose transferase-like glycosyltransferase